MRALTTLVLLAASATALPGQRWCNSPGAEPPAYADCALRLIGDDLVRGDRREALATSDRATPLPLRRFVTGDSAVKYALLYERDAFRATNVRFAAGALLLAGSIVTLRHRQSSPLRSANQWTIGTTLMLGSGPLWLLSVPLQRRADREAERAVWLHNDGLRRSGGGEP